MDVRTRYTKQVMKDALIELLETRSLQEVTVKELCAEAGVNRSTLYAHYDGVYGLYDEAEGEFLDEIWDVSISNSQARTAEQRLENYVNVCRFYRDNRQRLIVFYRQSIPGSSFADKILARLWTSSREHYTEHGEDVAREAYLLLGYGNAGYMHVIFSWLLDYPEMPAEEVARLLVSVHRGPSHILDSKQRRA